mmetsp:Transcript_36965/g.68218  ORF Transcript_36965/g.68218 Transcript_36965/m.68218 type:complete len:90 (+) Transcript_36965:118-387(+)
MSSKTSEAKQLRSIVVTGGNKGIGLAIVKKILAEQPYSYVFLGSRSLERGQAALKSILNEDNRKRVSVLQLMSATSPRSRRPWIPSRLN